MEDIILYYTCKYFGDWERIYDALEDQEEIDFNELEVMKEKYEDQYITIMSSGYPNTLKQLERPPFVIFYRGDVDLLNNERKIWYFGNYYNEVFDKETKNLVKDINKEDITIVTGYTNDFERSFNNKSIPKNRIIVKDSGIDSFISMTRVEEDNFVKSNLIITEYPDSVIPSLHTWRQSNRIKHGLAKKMFLINTLKERNMFEIISNAIDENTVIYCYDKNIDEKSHNSLLISKGAYAINNINELWGKGK